MALTAPTFNSTVVSNAGSQTHGYLFGTKSMVLPDADTEGNDISQLGAQQQAMSNNSLIIARSPSKGLGYYVLDTERSTPANPVLVKLYGG